MTDWSEKPQGMLRQLLAIFHQDNPMHEIGRQFVSMLGLTEHMTVQAGRIFFEGGAHVDRSEIYRRDIEVNRFERELRRRIVAHLSIAGNTSDAAYCLLLMSLVKDVERLGDYAKNLSEVEDLRREPLPADDIVERLRDVRGAVEATFRAAGETFSTTDHQRALELIEAGRGTAHQCDVLLERISAAEHRASTIAALVLGARHYKRINGHLLNVLSSVVMPVHKVDYFDEDEIPRGPRTG